MIRWIRIGTYERGFVFRRDEFRRVLAPGRYVLFDPLLRLRVARQDVTEPRIEDAELDVIVASGALGEEAQVVDLPDRKRALVWIDGRLASVLRPGLYAFWTILKDVRVEVIDASEALFDNADAEKALALREDGELLEKVDVDANTVGLFYRNGVFQRTLAPGRYVFWKGEGQVVVRHVDLREQVLDVGGQEIMTSDKVTLRLNAVLTYRVKDAVTAVAEVSDYAQAIYRDAQLALRAVVGTKTLDVMLDDKDGVADELAGIVRPRLDELGLALGALGIRDVILPGEMKQLLNRVTEARTAAEANLITRREETAAVRSQLNAAKILESNPTLMRLRELEVLEKVTEKAQLQVVLGDSGLADKVVKLL